MKGTVIIDSSVWIEVMRSRENGRLLEEVTTLLTEGDAAMCAPIWFELARGVKGKREEEQLSHLKKLCHWFEFNEECWVVAGDLGRETLRKGVNVSTGDLLVYACSKYYKTRLLHRDRHFEMIQRVDESK